MVAVGDQRTDGLPSPLSKPLSDKLAVDRRLPPCIRKVRSVPWRSSPGRREEATCSRAAAAKVGGGFSS
jgi:hypothetical protein